MYSASELFKKAMKAQHRELRSRLTIDKLVLTDTEIQSFEIEDSILTNDEFRLGTATASAFKITINNIYGSYNKNQFENKTVNIEVGLVLEKFNKDVEFQTLGTFIVEKAEKNEKLIVLTGYDNMILLDKEYISKLTYPATLIDIATEICTLAGIKLENKEFLNSNYVVQINPTINKKVTLREAIAMISELACGYACINRKANLEIVTIKESGEEINSHNYFNLKKDENIVIFNKVIINEVIKGNGDNAIVIINNIFAQDPQKLIDSIFNAINGFSFLPFNCKWQGNVLLKSGDKLTINDGENKYTSFIARQKITYDNGLRSEISTKTKPKLAKDFEYKGTLKKENQVTNSKVTYLEKKSGEILLKVDKDSIINTINHSEESEVINSNKLDLGGLATVDSLKNGTAIIKASCLTGDIENKFFKIIHNTKNYSDRLMNTYATADVFIGDLGFGVIKNGVCEIKIDEIMRECFNTNIPYHVFTQAYNGKITQIDRYPSYFVVKGDESTEFSWEVKAKRLGYENIRLEKKG